MSAARPSPYREWAVLLVASLAMFLNTVDISILNVAMPVIERDLGVEMRLLQWLQGIYGLSCAGFLLLSGRLADLIGRRRVFLTGVFLFGAASSGGIVAPGFAVLLAARAIQGIGAALMVPSAVSIISTTFEEGPRRNRALGIFSAVAPVSEKWIGASKCVPPCSGADHRIDPLHRANCRAAWRRASAQPNRPHWRRPRDGGPLGHCLRDHDARWRSASHACVRVAGCWRRPTYSLCLP